MTERDDVSSAIHFLGQLIASAVVLGGFALLGRLLIALLELLSG